MSHTSRERGAVNPMVRLVGIVFGYVTGVNPVEVGSALAESIAALRRAGSRLIDWRLEDWPLRYLAEGPKVVSLRLPGHTPPVIRIPYVLEIDNARAAAPLEEFLLVKAGRFKPESYLTAPRQAAIEHYRRVDPRLFDGPCARLSDYDPETRTLSLGEVSYFDTLATNMAMDLPDETGATLRELFHQDALQPVGASDLADPLGINVLLVCEGGNLVVLKRAETVAVRPGELCPSASGTVKTEDVRGPSFLEFDVFREVREELGKPVEDACGETQFLGLARDLVRGGLPDLFFVATCALTPEEIRAAWANARDREESSEVLFFPIGPYHRGSITDRPGGLPGFQRLLRETLTKMSDHGPISPMLWTQLALWYQWRENGHG